MDLQQALQTAMKGEIEGRELYRAAAEKTGDTKAREVFGMLADEEQSHLDSLIQIGKDYEAGKDLTVPQLPAPASFEDAESPIFTREFKEKVSDFDMSALSIGMKLELESEKTYRQMAEETDQYQLKELFIRLADWEQGHFDFLQKQKGFLESYYTQKYSFYRF
ncbi:MAG: ferritin family protein [Desulfohalobiaceae bacterium]|nr:ferritin family protein [Desulfohalobiaceae bacterium]